MSKNQEYIARIRYQNDLPPPLLPPKLLNYNVNAVEEVGSSSLLSNLYRKENIRNLLQINNDLGLEIDLVSQPDIFNNNLDSNSDSKQPKLHPNDQVLLRDPGVDRIVKSQPNVSFLRRTEYIGSARSQQLSRSVTPAPQESKKFDPSTLAGQLHSIEATFENATKTLNNPATLRHPLKKNLKAKKAWSVLPDVSRMDQLFTAVRVSTRQGDADPDWLNKAVFRQLTLDMNDNLNWLSIYTLNETDEAKKEKFVKKINELNENLPNEQKDEDLEERFRFLKQGDYEMKPQRLDNTPVSNANTDPISATTEIKEIAIRFDNETNTVYYNPIQLKTELKKRKLQDHYQGIFDDLNIDELNLKIREPTVEELNKRNNKRHKHDDITYESTEHAKDEDEDDLEEIRKSNLS